MVHYSHFNNHNLLKHNTPKGRGATAITKDKSKQTTLRYNLAKPVSYTHLTLPTNREV